MANRLSGLKGFRYKTDPAGPSLATQIAAKENAMRLDGCKGHDFETLAAYPGTVKCSACGGETASLNAYFYRRGVEHGRGFE